MSTPNRIAQTERAYRNQMREKLIDLLKVMNPQDTLQFQGMKYEELVTYTRDWLNTEVGVLTAPVEEAESVKLVHNQPNKSFSKTEEPKKIPAQAALGLE